MIIDTLLALTLAGLLVATRRQKRDERTRLEALKAFIKEQKLRDRA